MNELHSIDVCLATFKRPHLLPEALRSLAGLNLDGIRMRLIVVDNDHAETAQATVDAYRKAVPFEVLYDVEPIQNIALARNRALAHIQADYFAFFDDDETVPSDWLTTLLATLKQYDADVVFGPALGILPPDAPLWAKDQPTFRRTRRDTGTAMVLGATGNVLVRRAALGQPPQRFDPAYGLSGGEDADFFYRLHCAGKRMVWCDEAVVTEHVPTNRLTPTWVRQRGFRSGQSYARIVVSREPLQKKVVWFAMKVTQLFGAILSTPIARVVSYPLYVRLTVRIMATLGQLSVVFSGFVYEEYHANRHK